MDLSELPAAPLKHSPLPDVLQTPEVRTGRNTRHVEFITDSAISIALREGNLSAGFGSRKGPVFVNHWAPHSDFRLIAKTKVEFPFRISFVIELSGDIVPLQQCTDVRFEEGHTLRKEHWVRDPEMLVGMWEPTPVSKQLET